MSSSMVTPRAAGHSRTVPLLIALTPLLLLAMTAIGSSAVSVLLSAPPAIASVPLGVALELLGLIWMAAGAAIVWRARSPLIESLALMLFTIPATVLVVLTPTLVEAMQTLR